MHKRDQELHGLLIVDKPGQQTTSTPTEVDAPSMAEASAMPQPLAATPTRKPTNRDFTSHDVVQVVRRWSGQRQIGHTGTLDPMASGVLVLCLGAATRLVEYYQGHAKQYYAEIVLGRATDTYDATGVTCATAAIPPLTLAQIEAALQQFRGDILQLPPIYSALKQGGETLYQKARRGEVVTVTPRPVSFYQIDLVAYRPPDRICLRVHCSAGTYIRSLAYDLGLALQTVAHLAVLRREAAGQFSLADAHSLTEIEQMAQQGRLSELLLPLGVGLDMPSIQLDDELIRRFGHGQKVVLDSPAVANEQLDLLVAGYDTQGRSVGILRCLAAATPPHVGFVWKAEKWFIQS